MHHGVAAFDLLPQSGRGASLVRREFFAVDYRFFLNLIFLIVSAGLAGGIILPPF